MEEYIIKAQGLKKIYRLPAEEIIALKEIDFAVKKGEFVTIMGPSGAGKTTLLNLIGCLDVLTLGDLEVLGHNISKIKEKKLTNLRRGNIGFVFQEFFLISSLTALENVELPLYFTKSRNKREKAVKFLKDVGLEHRLNHFPSELSGGEIQRVAIARALVTEPAIVLADEPTGNLDTKNTREIFNLFRQFNQEEKITILVATHNVKLGYKSDRVIQLRDGRIEKDESVN